MSSGPAIKHGLKRALKRAVAAVSPAGPPESTRILTYHSVGVRAHEMNVAPADFRAQMEWLVAHARVIPLEEAAQGMPGVAITFDDGYRDNLEEAAPVLARLGLPSTVFVVAGRMGGWLDHDPQDESARLMTWDALRETEALGMRAGSHTLHHRRLSELSEEKQRAAIADAKRLIEDQLQHPVPALAYPFGAATDYTAVSMRVAEEVGHAFAVSNRFGPVSKPVERWAIRRIWIDASDTLAMFQAKVQGRLDAFQALDSAAGLALRRGLNRFLRV